MDDAERKRIALAMREYIASNGITRESFAYKANVSVGTIHKMLIGIFTEKGLAKVEKNIGVRFRSHNIIRKTSSDFHGSYTYDESFRYEGYYEFVRFEFDNKDVIHTYAMQVLWSEADACLIIKHLGISESDYKQFGKISIPKNAPFFFILSDSDGWHQLCIMSKLDYSRTMYGGLFSLSEVGFQQFAPRAVPVVLKGAAHETQTRKITRMADDFESYLSHFEKIKGFINLP